MLVGDAQVLAFGPRDGSELIQQPGLLQRPLTGLYVQVQRAALCSAVARRLAFKDGNIQSRLFEYTSEYQTSGSGADDNNIVIFQVQA